MLTAAKYLDDFRYSNADFAKIGGLQTKELNKLEEDFLLTINFNLLITTEQYQAFCEKIIGQTTNPD